MRYESFFWIKKKFFFGSSNFILKIVASKLYGVNATIIIFVFVLYCIVFYFIVLYCIVLYCIVLYCNVLYCIVLYCIVLYCIVFLKYNYLKHFNLNIVFPILCLYFDAKHFIYINNTYINMINN